MSGATAPPRVHAVLFDLDGVLIDTTAAVVGLWRQAAARRAVTLSERALRDHVLGCAPEHSVEALFEQCTHRDRASILEEIRLAEPGLGFTVMPAAPGLLRALSEAGVPLALVTGASRERVARVRDALPELGQFHATVTWGEPDRGKPHPEPYLLAAARLGLSPARCAVLEDTPSGVRAAAAAGAYCIGITDPVAACSLRASGAAAVVSSLSQLSVLGTGRGTRLAVAGTVISLSHGHTDQKEAARWR